MSISGDDGNQFAGTDRQTQTDEQTVTETTRRRVVRQLPRTVARDGKEPSLGSTERTVRFDFFASTENMGSVRVRFSYSLFSILLGSVLCGIREV